MARNRRLLLVAFAAVIGLAGAGWFWMNRPVEPNPTLRLPPIDRLVVDKSERRMAAYSQGKLVHIFHSIELGDVPAGHKHFEGDEKTPEGLYTIDGRNSRSRFHLSLHISYPNAKDRQFAADAGRSPGGNVFVHGQPNWLLAGRLKRDWTDGCIAMSNDEIEALWLAVKDGTPIEIRP